MLYSNQSKLFTTSRTKLAIIIATWYTYNASLRHRFRSDCNSYPRWSPALIYMCWYRQTVLVSRDGQKMTNTENKIQIFSFHMYISVRNKKGKVCKDPKISYCECPQISVYNIAVLFSDCWKLAMSWWYPLKNQESRVHETPWFFFYFKAWYM